MVVVINVRGLGWKALLRIRNESRLQLLGHSCILRLIGWLLNPYQLMAFSLKSRHQLWGIKKTTNRITHKNTSGWCFKKMET